MNFSEALQAMKNGKKVKRRIWGGYWYWDSEKETIMMRTKDDETLDIRDTKNVEYTLGHILENDWIEATTENCPMLGGELTFGFGTALQYMQRGYKLTRKGWNNEKACLIDSSLGIMLVGSIAWGDSVRNCVLSSTDIVATDWMFAR